MRNRENLICSVTWSRIMTNSNKAAQRWFMVALFVAALAAPPSAPAAAFLFPSLGAAGSFAMFGLTASSGYAISQTGATINGNEGISIDTGSGAITINSPNTVTGSLYQAQNGQFTGQDSGLAFTNAGLMTTANNDYTTALGLIAGATATQTIITQINGAQNITGNGSGIAVANVIDFTNAGAATLNNANLTLNGGANDYFIVRISALSMTLSGTGSLALGTGVIASHVIFDFVNAAATVTVSAGATDSLSGYIIDPNGAMTLGGTTVVNGELIGKTMTLNANTTVNGVTPEPSTLFLIGGALIAIGAGSKRLRRG